MGKAIEETWDVAPDADKCGWPELYRVIKDGRRVSVATFADDGVDGPVNAQDRARAALAAAAPEMARMLLAREWTSNDENPPDCRSCGANEPWPFLSDEDAKEMGQGHKPSCTWVALMRKAGVLK